MQKASLILCLLLLLFRHSLAQSPLSIRGMVGDSTGIALTGATVLLISSQDSLSVITKEDGHFQFKLSETKAFEIQVTMKGYLPYKKKYTPGEKVSSFQLKPIVLQTDYHELDPVIVARVRPITLGEDTITYHAGAFKVRDGSEVEALLKKLPGVEVDMDGNVIVQGKKVARAMVDGKLFFGGDVLTAIRNLPADIVDKLQVIDDYGDKARLTGVKSGESTKVLNIVLKEDKRSGSFGKLQAGIGNKEKYLSDLSVNFFSGEQQLTLITKANNNSSVPKDINRAIGLNYANSWASKWKVEFSASYNTKDHLARNNVVQDNYYTKGQIDIDQTMRNTDKNKAGNFSSTLTYIPDPYHILRIAPVFNINKFSQLATAELLTTQKDIAISKNSRSTTTNQINGEALAEGVQLYYEQLSQRSKRRFNIALNTQYSDNTQLSDYKLYSVVQVANESSSSTEHYLFHNVNPVLNLGASINYFAPIGKTAFWEFGYAWDRISNKSTKNTYSQDSFYSVFIPLDSLNVIYSYISSSQRIHAGYNAHFKNLNLYTGADLKFGRLVSSITKGREVLYSYTDLLATLQTSYNVSKHQTLSIIYNGRSALPEAQQLQSVPDLTNPQYPIVGNPSLRPAYIHSLNLSYVFSDPSPSQFMGLNINLGYTNTQNPVVSNAIHPKDSSAIIQKTEFVNSKYMYSYYAGYHLNLPALLSKKIFIIVDGELVSSHIFTITDYISNPTVGITGSQGIHIQFFIPDVFESEASGIYTWAINRYSTGSSGLIPSLTCSLNNRHYFYHRWILSYQFLQYLTTNPGHVLRANPATLVASIQWHFLKKNIANIGFTGYNLLNETSAAGQSVTPTSITQTRMDISGRYFVINFILKLNKFNK